MPRIGTIQPGDRIHSFVWPSGLEFKSSNVTPPPFHSFTDFLFFSRRLSRPLHGSSGRKPADGQAAGPRHPLPAPRGPDALPRPRSCDAEREGQQVSQGGIHGRPRNRDPLLCPLSALAFYFFWRWGYVVTDPKAKKPAAPPPPPLVLRPERLPPPARAAGRNQIPGAPGNGTDGLRRRRDPVDQEDSRHPEGGGTARGGGRDSGIPDPAGRPLGYPRHLEGFPEVFMRKMPGFPEEAGSFYLPRAELEPPPALTWEIYPEVDEGSSRWRRSRPARDMVQDT